MPTHVVTGARQAEWAPHSLFVLDQVESGVEVWVVGPEVSCDEWEEGNVAGGACMCVRTFPEYGVAIHLLCLGPVKGFDVGDDIFFYGGEGFDVVVVVDKLCYFLEGGGHYTDPAESVNMKLSVVRRLGSRVVV